MVERVLVFAIKRRYTFLETRTCTDKAPEDLTPLIQGGGGSPLKCRARRDYVPNKNLKIMNFSPQKENLKIMNFAAKKYETNERNSLAPPHSPHPSGW